MRKATAIRPAFICTKCNTLLSSFNHSTINQEKKKIKAVPVNMIFGVLLIEGEEDDDDDSDDDGDGVIVGPSFIDFIYDHANPTCPLPIDPVTITGPVGGEWVMNTAPPIWLSPSQTSGTIPATQDLSFPCRLDTYTNQEQSETLTYTVTAPDGTVTTHTVEIKGSFTNF